jgi:hypothetical protein
MAKKKPLTDRQQEILAALEGRSVAEAAKKLGIKPAAVYGPIALDEAKAEREKLVAKLADVDGVIEQHTATLGVLADVSARLHNAPISA